MRQIDYSQIEDYFKIDMVESARGCTENCIGCGYYDCYGGSIETLDRKQIETNITQVIGYTGIYLIELFNNYITTQVNTEPLRSDAFIDLAELVFEFSNEQSRVVAISHGVRYGNLEMIERLEKVVNLMEQNKVPLFVLSFDLARSAGKYKKNFEAYLQTIEILKRALNKARITVSIQGNDDKESSVYIGKARQLFKKVILETGLNESDLNVNERVWIPKGRAKKLNISNPEVCHVIPDPEFVEKYLNQKHQWHGFIDFDGTILSTDRFDYESCLNTKDWLKFVA